MASKLLNMAHQMDLNLPFVKICGVRGGADVETALDYGANAVGVMLTKSPRQITTAQAREVTKQVGGRALVVGVFHGESPAEIKEAVEASEVSGIQLHGNHPRSDFSDLRELNRLLIRAVSADAPDLKVGAYGEDMLIVDAPKPGSGETWDYASMREKLSGHWILAGGLDPYNVEIALEESDAWGVDVSSGVEAQRGIKDPNLIAEFLAAARVATA